MSAKKNGSIAPKTAETLKFRGYLASPILAGRQWVTVRLKDERKFYSVGSTITLLDSSSGKSFGKAKILEVTESTLGKVPHNLEGNQSFRDLDAMKHMYTTYYGNNVRFASPVEIVRFGLVCSCSNK